MKGRFFFLRLGFLKTRHAVWNGPLSDSDFLSIFSAFYPFVIVPPPFSIPPSLSTPPSVSSPPRALCLEVKASPILPGNFNLVFFFNPYTAHHPSNDMTTSKIIRAYLLWILVALAVPPTTRARPAKMRSRRSIADRILYFKQPFGEDPWSKELGNPCQ